MNRVIRKPEGYLSLGLSPCLSCSKLLRSQQVHETLKPEPKTQKTQNPKTPMS